MVILLLQRKHPRSGRVGNLCRIINAPIGSTMPSGFMWFALVGILLIVFGSLSLSYAKEVIQTQESDTVDGIEVDLTSIKIKDNIVIYPLITQK